MNASPKVSIVMAVRDGASYLQSTLESLRAQTLPDYELIAVDDGSQDATPAILDGWPDRRMIRIRNPSPLGLAASLNRGLEIARADYVARQDADDLARPDRLAEQVSFLDAHSSVVLLGSSYHLIDEAGRNIGIQRQPCDDDAIRWQMLFHNAFCHSSVMARRSCIEKSGFYDPSLTFAQDYDLWSRCLKFGQGANLDAPLISLRQHMSSMSAVAKQEQQRTAGKIALSNMKDALGCEPDDTSAALLRSWYYGLPEQLPAGGAAAILLMRDLLKRRGTDRAKVQWARRLLRHPDAPVGPTIRYFIGQAPRAAMISLLLRLLGRTATRPDRVRKIAQ
ncbi:MAG: glycosyltransferase [Alphaproteobacteria bacterium]|nr:glycosyltransferase [Alphaproteobacteria bacterium]